MSRLLRDACFWYPKLATFAQRCWRIALIVILASSWPAAHVAAADLTFGSATVFESATTNVISMVPLDSTHVVVAYQDAGNSSHGTAAVGTISGNTISFGTPVVFESSSTTYISVDALSSSAVVIGFRDSVNAGYAIVGTVSGSSISFGTAQVLDDTTSASDISVAAASSTKFVISYSDNDSFNFGFARVGTVSGSTISYGTRANFLGAEAASLMSSDSLDSTHVVVAYQGESGQGRAVVGTISGSSLSFDTANADFFESGGPLNIAVTALSNSSIFVAYTDSDNSNYLTTVAATISGTTVSFGTATVRSTGSAHISSDKLSSTQAIVVYEDTGNSNQGTTTIASVSGTTVTLGTADVFETSTTTHTAAAALSSTAVAVAYSDGGNSNFGTALVGSTDSTAPTISTLSPADGATGVAASSNLVITFDEAVDVESGNITIKKASDSSTVETIDVTSGQVTGSGSTTITVNPASDLASATSYYVQIDATAFDDAASNSFAGISDTTTWNFTTINTAPTASTPTSISQATDGTGYLTFKTTISDSDNTSTQLKVEYSTDQSTWRDPQLVSVAANRGDVSLDNGATYQIQSIDTDAGTVTLTIVWDAAQQFADSEESAVYLRVVPYDGITAGSGAVSESFALDTRAPTLSGVQHTASTLSTLTIIWVPGSTDSNFNEYTICYGTTVAAATACTTSWTESNDAALATQGTATTRVTGLGSATTYYLTVGARDAFGNETTSAVASGSTTTGTGPTPTPNPTLSPAPSLGVSPVPSPTTAPDEGDKAEPTGGGGTTDEDDTAGGDAGQPPAAVRGRELLTRAADALNAAVQALGAAPVTSLATAAAAPVAAVSLAASASTISALPTLFGNLTSLGSRLLQALAALLGFRGRRRPWGRVVNAATGEPIGGAAIYVISRERQKVIETIQSKADGTFVAFVPPGTYDFRVVKNGWELVPDAAVPQRQIDEQVYAGRPITVTAETLVKVVFALQPERAELAAPRLFWQVALQRVEYVLQRISWPLLLFGMGLSTVAVVAQPTGLNIGIEAVYAILIVGKLFVERSFERALGTVTNAETGQPLDLAAVRLYDAATNRLVATQVTSQGGKFFLRVNPGVYTLAVVRAGYAFYREAHMIVRSADKPLALTVALKPESPQPLAVDMAGAMPSS